jgi:aspartate aminotransferase, cytoplasmic
LDRDAFAVRKFVQLGIDVFVAQSYSKNFGLYCERTGCLTVAASSPEIAKNVRSQLAKLNRSLISNPPAFGARIVSKILNDPQLFSEWNSDLLVMVNRIKTMRKSLHEQLVHLKTPGNWDHIVTQIGMFSYTGMTKTQSVLMKEKFHIYLTENGRISIAGLTSKNMDYFAQSMDWVIRNCHE